MSAEIIPTAVKSERAHDLTLELRRFMLTRQCSERHISTG